MQGPFEFVKRYEYPHLTKGEADIWQRFIEKYPDYFETCWYDVELGTPRNFSEETPEPYRSHHRYLGGYKIDVLGLKDGKKTIVEVKRQATTKALGEIWCYDFLYRKDLPKENEIDLMILTDEEMPHMREICEEEGVWLVVV